MTVADFIFIEFGKAFAAGAGFVAFVAAVTAAAGAF